MAAIEAGKHILAEKPLALNAKQATEMYQAAEAKGIKQYAGSPPRSQPRVRRRVSPLCAARLRSMTAFTYRFAPALRYLTKLCKDGELGELRHFRSQRFLDWPETSWGWRQYKATAGAGNLYDMTSHRSAFLHSLPASGCLLPRSWLWLSVRLLSQHGFAHLRFCPAGSTLRRTSWGRWSP